MQLHSEEILETQSPWLYVCVCVCLVHLYLKKKSVMLVWWCVFLGQNKKTHKRKNKQPSTHKITSITHSCIQAYILPPCSPFVRTHVHTHAHTHTHQTAQQTNLVLIEEKQTTRSGSNWIGPSGAILFHSTTSKQQDNNNNKNGCCTVIG